MLTVYSVVGQTIEIKAGPQEDTVFVHKPLLGKASKFFQAAMKDEWKEGQLNIIRLPAESPKDVHAYVQWLYAGKIYVSAPGNSPKIKFGILSELYVLGERLLDDTFQNQVINAMVMLYRSLSVGGGKSKFVTDEVVRRIYDNTTHNSPARRFIADTFVCYGNKSSMGRGEGALWDVSGEFKDDLLERLLTYSNGQDDEAIEALRTGVPCRYHKHEGGKTCEAE